MDVLTTLFCVVAFVAVVLGAEYYVALRKAKREYDRAKGIVEDVVFSFNRQLRRETARGEATAYKVEAVSSRVDEAFSGIGELRGTLGNMKETLLGNSHDRESLTMRLANLEKKAGGIAATYENLVSRVAVLEEQTTQQRFVPDSGFEAAIPIKREKALAQLTDTEVCVLEFLTSEGSRTAPEIKERVKLSREHTARLMKRLYEEGYLERETGKIPFRYTVKKEMEKFLKKTENETM